mmetsp:Transcript_47657/g.140738  ORF Transcript_47657/g.140738 Transcript_47657/m.140738 type:complete len:120 (-) Transcript_47657:1236-1595(-)
MAADETCLNMEPDEACSIIIHDEGFLTESWVIMTVEPRVCMNELLLRVCLEGGSWRAIKLNRLVWRDCISSAAGEMVGSQSGTGLLDFEPSSPLFDPIPSPVSPNCRADPPNCLADSVR